MTCVRRALIYARPLPEKAAKAPSLLVAQPIPETAPRSLQVYYVPGRFPKQSREGFQSTMCLAASRNSPAKAVNLCLGSRGHQCNLSLKRARPNNNKNNSNWRDESNELQRGAAIWVLVFYLFGAFWWLQGALRWLPGRLGAFSCDLGISLAALHLASFGSGP